MSNYNNLKRLTVKAWKTNATNEYDKTDLQDIHNVQGHTSLKLEEGGWGYWG